MGWIKSPLYFCAASETAQNVTVQYIKHPVGSLAQHKFQHHSIPEGTAMEVGSDNTIIR
jgi:hypothetical protein